MPRLRHWRYRRGGLDPVHLRVLPNEDNCAQATTGNVAVHCIRDFWGRPACGMPCQGGDVCPDGLRCLPDMQGKTWCVAPGFKESDARSHLSAEVGPPSLSCP